MPDPSLDRHGETATGEGGGRGSCPAGGARPVGGMAAPRPQDPDGGRCRRRGRHLPVDRRVRAAPPGGGHPLRGQAAADEGCPAVRGAPPADDPWGGRSRGLLGDPSLPRLHGEHCPRLHRALPRDGRLPLAARAPARGCHHRPALPHVPGVAPPASPDGPPGILMDVLGHLASGFAAALSPTNLMMAVLGSLLGTFVGVLPGLGPTAAIAILFPLTTVLAPVPAIIMLAGIYYGAMYGGSTTAILLNIPGEVASVPTCLDGYPMAQQGRGGVALGISAIGSFFSGTLGVVGLTFFAPFLADQALTFPPPPSAVFSPPPPPLPPPGRAAPAPPRAPPLPPPAPPPARAPPEARVNR